MNGKIDVMKPLHSEKFISQRFLVSEFWELLQPFLTSLASCLRFVLLELT